MYFIVQIWHVSLNNFASDLQNDSCFYKLWNDFLFPSVFFLLLYIQVFVQIILWDLNKGRELTMIPVQLMCMQVNSFLSTAFLLGWSLFLTSKGLYFTLLLQSALLLQSTNLNPTAHVAKNAEMPCKWKWLLSRFGFTVVKKILFGFPELKWISNRLKALNRARTLFLIFSTRNSLHACSSFNPNVTFSHSIK